VPSAELEKQKQRFYRRAGLGPCAPPAPPPLMFHRNRDPDENEEEEEQDEEDEDLPNEPAVVREPDED
jgi:hypothetical protein